MADPSGTYDALLNAFMSADNAVRRQAEAAWEDAKRRAPDEVLEKMCGVLARREPGSEGLRAMAAVLLRTLFDLRSDIWSRVQPQTKAGVKSALLARLTEEPVAHIRRKLTHAVGQLAGVSASEAEWPEVMALTVALCGATQPSPEFKVVGLDLVNILAEFCLQSLSPHEAGLLQMFDACLEDPSVGVRVAALKALCSCLQDVFAGSPTSPDPSLAQKMMAVLEATVTSGDEDAARDVLEALNVVAAKRPQLLVGEALDLVGKGMLAVAASPSLEVATRELSLEFLTSLCESAPSVLRERGAATVQALVPLAIHIMAQPQESADEDLAMWLSTTDGGPGDDDVGGEDELGMVAASTLSRVAIALGGEAVLSSALPVCSEFLGNASDWRRRKAGLLTILLIGEGCGEDMASSGLLPQIVLGPVLAGVGDAHPRVRHAALGCLGQMAEDYGDWDGGSGGGDDEEEEEEGGSGSFQGTFHAQLLPSLVQSLGGPNTNMPRLQAAAAGTLTTFCNPTRMQAEWLYAPLPAEMGGGDTIGKALLDGLCALVRESPSVVVREEALTATGCVAQVLGPGFGSFYPTFIPLAKEILSSTPAFADADGRSSSAGAATQSTDTLRGKAMEAIALMGQAVGADMFRADAHQVIRVLIAEQKTVSRDPGNPQSTYTLQALARMAGVLGGEFLPYLEDAVTPLLAALSTDAEIKVSSASNMATAKEEMEAAGLTALEMDLRGVGRQLFGVNTSLMQAKESACRTLYQYTQDLAKGFAPHAPRTLAVVLPNLGPRNAVAVQVVSAAIVPRLVCMACHHGNSPAVVAEAQAMLDASIDALCEVVSRIAGEQGESMGSGGDMEPACIAADSLSTLLEDHCKVKYPSPLTVTAKGELTAVTVLRDAAAMSMRRSEARAAASGRIGMGHHPLAGLTGAVDYAEMEEQEEWEEDLLTSSVDGIGWIIKGKRGNFMSTFDSMLKPFVIPLLRPDEAPKIPEAFSDMPPSQRSYGLCMCIDILEYGGDGGRISVLPALLPALMRGCADEVSSTRQACAYGLGVAAEFGGAEFDAASPEALHLLLGLIAQGQDPDSSDDIASVTDNAVSAAFRVVFARLSPVISSISGRPYAGDDGRQESAHVTPILKSLLGMLPLEADVAEGHDCHRRIVELACSRHPVLVGWESGQHIPELLSALAGIMSYQPSPQEEAEAAAGGDGVGTSGHSESESELWARQPVDRETREKAEQAVGTLRNAFPQVFGSVWARLGGEEQRAMQMPTSSIRPHGV